MSTVFSRRSSPHHTLPLVAVGLLMALFLTACGSSEPVQLRLPLSLEGSSSMNSGGNAAVVRVYQLASGTTFRQAPIESFWQDDEGVLGSDLVVPKVERTLYPDDVEEITLEIHDDTRYIAIAADLRDPEADHWRQLFTVDEVEAGQPFIVQVGERRLRLALHPAPTVSEAL